MPLVSIIIPVYNSERFIEAAIDSATGQTEKDLEIIVIDDGSTDSTHNIVRKLAAIDSRITIYFQPNSGKPSIARNNGLKISTGEYICFLDGDDVYHPDKIRLQLKFLQHNPAIDTIFHDVCYMEEDGTLRPETYLQKPRFREKVLSELDKIGDATYLCKENNLFFFMCTSVTTILQSAVMIRRTRLNKEHTWFPENLKIGEDIDLWFRVVKSGGVAFMDKVLSNYRQYPLSVTKHPARNRFDPVEAHIRNYPRTNGYLSEGQRKVYRERIARDLYDLGYDCYNQGKNKEARSLYRQSLQWQSLQWQWNWLLLKAAVKTYLSPRV